MSNLVAVYGTLKRGFGNNILLQGSTPDTSGEFLGEHTIPEGFFMRSLGGFPAIFKATNDKSIPIKCEIFRVTTDSMMEDLDGLEGHPRWYKRELIPTQWGDAWVYVMPGGYEDHPIVESGEWLPYERRRLVGV